MQRIRIHQDLPTLAAGRGLSRPADFTSEPVPCRPLVKPTVIVIFKILEKSCYGLNFNLFVINKNFGGERHHIHHTNLYLTWAVQLEMNGWCLIGTMIR